MDWKNFMAKGGGEGKRYNEWILQAIVNADMAVHMHFYALFEGVA